MKQRTSILFCLAALIAAACAGNKSVTEEPSLKSALGDKFLVGVAINTAQSSGQDTNGVKAIKKHFNSIVAENCMKNEVVHPAEDRYDFDKADEFIQFGEDNHMAIIGHCLIWHSQCAPWFCVDKDGNNVTPEVLKQRMKDNIYTVAGRYKGRVKGWDVVNEAILENGTYRKSKFYEILGEEFIPLAFQYAHEADPDAELYLNDYNMHCPDKRATVVKIIRDLKARGLRIDGIGMQGHIGMDYPELSEFEASMEAYAAEGMKVMITEFDMSALPTVNQSANVSDRVEFQKKMNPYVDGLPDSVSVAWNNRLGQFLDLFIKHADYVDRVTVWGVSDGDSWRNNFPMPGRTDYPTFIDRKYQLKPALQKLVDGSKK